MVQCLLLPQPVNELADELADPVHRSSRRAVLTCCAARPGGLPTGCELKRSPVHFPRDHHHHALGENFIVSMIVLE